MADNFEKLWLQPNQNALAINRARQAIKSLGRALPCRVTDVVGKLVVIQFEMNTAPWTLPPITIPKAESAWLTEPTQIGDTGLTVPADVYLGGISGLGGGIADFRQRGNLAALVFLPVGTKSFSPIDPNAAQLQGPNGTILRTTTGTTSSIVTNSNGTTITFGTVSLTVNASGVTAQIGSETFAIGPSGANSSLPLSVPEIVLPNGNVNTHYHSDPQGGNTGVMTG